MNKDGNLIYDNPQFPTCFESSINIHEIKSGVRFSPNPLTEVSELEVLNNAVVYNSLRITDVSGRTVREMPVSNNRVRIYKAGLKNGLYFYSLSSKTQVLRGKFVV
ncbi:MAG: T9SS type A sorting domain-containing protein [Bacteroidota bacterium]